MSTELLTSKEAYDGVVQVHAAPPPQDNYNLSSEVMDVLRLEICKSQVTRELMIDCLTVQQNNLAKQPHDFMHQIAPYGFSIGVAIGLIAVFMIIFNRK